jgi:pyridoxamine 5'-phosphate oxidase
MDDAGLPAFYDDLDASLREAWTLLVRGAVDRRSPVHTPVVGNVAADGQPRLRAMVLRKADPARRVLRFHTDWRSAKVPDLARDPRVSVHVYEPRAKIQLRIAGLARLHGPESALAQAAWDGSRPQSRECYAQPQAPAAPLADPHEADSRLPDGRAHFSALEVEAQEIEWLYLLHKGHRRARFVWAPEAGVWSKTWLAP